MSLVLQMDDQEQAAFNIICVSANSRCFSNWPLDHAGAAALHPSGGGSEGGDRGSGETPAVFQN